MGAAAATPTGPAASAAAAAAEPLLPEPESLSEEVAAEPLLPGPVGDMAAAASAGPLLALSLRFQLPSSCYATMLIRELTKQSTAKEFQASLSAGQDS